MTPHPDTPEFTAAVLGERISHLSPAISNPADAADSLIRHEAGEIRATAAKLSAALRSEPALTLTPAGRQSVLRRPGPARPSWIMPTAAAAGFAALLGGAALWLPGGNQVAGGQGAESRVPTVGINPTPVSGAVRPVSPQAPLATGKNAPALPAGSWVSSPPEAPVTVGGQAPGIKPPAPAPPVPVPAPPSPEPPARAYASPER